MNPIPALPGLYFVRLSGDELISVNHNDLKRRDRCIKVNSANSKYGMARNLRSRFRSYCRTFGRDRVQFDVLGLASTPEAIESRLHRHFNRYRIRGLSGRQNEWLAGIEPEMAYRQALEICRDLRDVRAASEVEPVFMRRQSYQKEPTPQARSFGPEDVVRAAKYLQARGMSEDLLSQCHHFGKQTYNDTLRWFTGKTRIQGPNNPIYAARLDFIMQGHMVGGDFNQLLRAAQDTFPFPHELSS